MTQNIIKYLDSDLRSSITNDVRDVALFHAHPRRKVEAGFFSIPREVFCYVDYLGGIAGKGKTDGAIQYIKDYFPSKYADFAELIYSIWRHGTVHEYKPKTFSEEYKDHKPKRIKVKWMSNNDNKKGNRDAHLKFFSMVRKRATIYLNVNTCQLVDDLIESLDNLISKLKLDKKFKNECQKRFNNSTKYKDISDVQGKIRQQMVYNQIKLAWQQKSPIKVDNRGRPVK